MTQQGSKTTRAGNRSNHLPSPRELSAEELRFSARIDREFTSTQELSGPKEFVGQERALAALDLGLGVSASGYNIFVSGLTGAESAIALLDRTERMEIFAV